MHLKAKNKLTTCWGDSLSPCYSLFNKVKSPTPTRKQTQEVAPEKPPSNDCHVTMCTSRSNLDIKNLFLYTDIQEDVYSVHRSTIQYVFSTIQHLECRLWKDLYVLSHSPSAWFDRFCVIVLQYVKSDYLVIVHLSFSGTMVSVV